MPRIYVTIIAALLAFMLTSNKTHAQACVNAPGKATCHKSVNDSTTSVSAPSKTSKGSCAVPGLWTTLFGSVVVNPDLTGTFTPPYCPQPLLLSITLQGSNAFTVRLIWTGAPGVCQSATETMSFTSSDCNTAQGSYVNDDGGSGVDEWQRAGTQISLSRSGLMNINAQGTPSGGTFSYSSKVVSGTSVARIGFAPGVSASDNPNATTLVNPANPSPRGAPSAGGLVEITASYTTPQTGRSDSKFSVPTFGLSCYYTASEADWGTPLSGCQSVTINHHEYSGTVTDPLGLTGTYCSSFIAQVKLQGSAYTNDGRMIQYDPSSNQISEVSEIDGADGTQVIADQTIARDRAIIPRNVVVDIYDVGSGLVANDTGGAIRGYRIDLYKGAGSTACKNFRNVISVAACTPGNVNCPQQNLPQ
jgi:3D (Asp-Asp-Asp) domain-containing protein